MSFRFSPKIVTDGLVLYLDAANTKSYVSGSTTWNDISRIGNNGSLINGPTFNSSNGGSIVFDGVNDYVSGNLTPISSWTMNLWYLSKDITSNVIYYPFSCTISASGLGFGGFYDVSTQNRWFFFDGVTVMSNSSMNVVINQWYHLTVTKTSTTYNLYTNGTLSMTTNGNNLLYTQYNLGKRADGDWFYVKGNIAQALLYNRALTATEVLQNFNTTKTRFGL